MTNAFVRSSQGCIEANEGCRPCTRRRCHPELAKDLYHPGSAVLERERWVVRPKSKAEGRRIKRLAPLQRRTSGMIEILRKLRMTGKNILLFSLTSVVSLL